MWGSSNSSSSSSNTQKPEQPAQSHEGRLAIANADTERPSLSVYDLKDLKVIDTKALNYMPSAMYSSPQLRYAVMLSRNNGVVQFADGGVFTQSNQLKINTPNILTFQLSGTTPAHYRSFNGTAALFYDGSASRCLSLKCLRIV